MRHARYTKERERERGRERGNEKNRKGKKTTELKT
jgi:hypothetical protein